MGLELTPRDIILGYLASFETGDPDAIARFVANDFVNEHTSALGESLAGRDEYRRRLAAFLAEFGDLTYEPEALIVDGDDIAVPYRMRGMWRGGQAPARFDIRGVFWFQVRDGAISRRVDYWDSGEFVRQTGADQ